MNRVGASAGGDPPPNKETLRRAAQIRIDVLTGSIQGLGFGLILGAGGWPLFRRTVLRGKLQFLHKKYWVFATLAVGAFGSFIGSVASCRNSLEVQLGGLESEHTRNQRRADEAFRRRQLAMQQGQGQQEGQPQQGLQGGREAPSPGLGGGAIGGQGSGVQEEGVLLDAGSGFPNPFVQPRPQPGKGGPSSRSF